MPILKHERKNLINLILVLVSVVVALLCAELIISLVILPAQQIDSFIWPPKLKVVFKPNPEIMPGISGDSEFRVNSKGLRGDEYTDNHDYRILAIGGSTTECTYLDQSETWAAILERSLNRINGKQNVWVGNGGVSGTTTLHHLIALKYLPLGEMKIDTVILLIGVNDLSHRLLQDGIYDPVAANNTLTEDVLISRVFRWRLQVYESDPLYKKTAIWQLARKAKQLLTPDHSQDLYGNIYKTWREHRRAASEVRDELPDLTTALQEYEQNINRIIDVLISRSIRPVFMTQPTMWRQDLPQKLSGLLWLGGVGDFQKEPGHPYYSARVLEKGMRAYNETLLKVCRSRSVDCIDLASMLEKDTTVFFDDVHFNESGAAKVADALTCFLVERGN